MVCNMNLDVIKKILAKQRDFSFIFILMNLFKKSFL